MKTIVILGQTATGKSELAFRLAKTLNGEIISADSIQIYKYFDVGSAKPSKTCLKEIKHHLIDIKEPDEDYSAQEFSIQAKQIIQEIKSIGKIPMLCGGTLFYIDALLNSLDLIPQVDSKIKNFFDSVGNENVINLYKWLKIIDPKWAQKINKNDKQRTIRALSVFLQTGSSLTNFFNTKKKENFFENCMIFSLQISDNVLEKRIIHRTTNMLDGLIEETLNIIKMGFAQTKPMQSIGYRQALLYINGKITKEEMTDSIIKETKLYAKRQKTYFSSKFKDKSIKVDYKNAFETIMEYLYQSHLP
ncbi:tRNA dimethylallyltransferase [Desulfurella amilsii]|uniref:tRNA dimethylallyltransferase n=1 Tax=Desulfurella amilsii TaxID=1562698 RepID=A0A1X4XUK0_9BACT|nr:tRNA (adenosine(37)-N6)-dimethylallyltransferase MiaA [Desulfurella amilsii]OSS41217.1 tRNA dimethylallyltransferase [Desulfurella amilsii]